MKTEIETISIKKFLIASMTGSILTVVFGIALGLILHTGVATVISMIVLMILTIYLSHIIAKTTCKITINENSLIFNDQEIKYDNIAGYFVNETGLTMTALVLRLKSHSNISINGMTVGKREKPFRELVSLLVETIKSKVEPLEDLNYQTAYPRQINILKPLIYLTIPIALLIDLFFLYQFIAEKELPPWQFLCMNATLFSLIPYIRNGKRKLS